MYSGDEEVGRQAVEGDVSGDLPCSRFGSDNFIWLKMFTVAHDSWTHSYQSRSPQLQCLGATDASSLAHQVTNSPSHSFNAACGCGQIQFSMFPIGSEMVHPSEKLSHDHAYDAQSCGLTLQISQLSEHDLQTGAVGEIESLAGKLVEGFAQSSASQSAIAVASAVLQATDDMEVAELHDPALGGAQSDNPRNLVGDRGPDASAYVRGDRRNRLRPAPQVLPAWQEQRIEEDGSTLAAGLHPHQVQHPVFPSKPEVNSIQDQNQRSDRQAQAPRSRHKPPQSLTTTATQTLTGKAIARRQSSQCLPVEQNCLQNSSAPSPRLAASPLFADSPRLLAATALATSRTEVMDFGSATKRFRVPRMHARELHTDSPSKYANS